MHPFDIKTIFFAKHAQHVVLIHFPIALFIIGVVFDFLGQWKGSACWWPRHITTCSSQRFLPCPWSLRGFSRGSGSSRDRNLKAFS